MALSAAYLLLMVCVLVLGAFSLFLFAWFLFRFTLSLIPFLCFFLWVSFLFFFCSPYLLYFIRSFFFIHSFYFRVARGDFMFHFCRDPLIFALSHVEALCVESVWFLSKRLSDWKLLMKMITNWKGNKLTLLIPFHFTFTEAPVSWLCSFPDSFLLFLSFHSFFTSLFYLYLFILQYWNRLLPFAPPSFSSVLVGRDGASSALLGVTLKVVWGITPERVESSPEKASFIFLVMPKGAAMRRCSPSRRTGARHREV
eukprot:07936_5